MNRAVKVVVVFCITVFLVSNYFLLKDHYERHEFDINRVPGRETRDYSSILRCAFERRNWDGLALSESFRKKFKSKYDFVEHPGMFVRYSNGYHYEDYKDDEELIVINYLREVPFDFDYTKGYYMNMYFRYKVDENGLLDDVELVRQEKTQIMTGRVIKE